MLMREGKRDEKATWHKTEQTPIYFYLSPEYWIYDILQFKKKFCNKLEKYLIWCE
jgi:hypothetical protein